MLGLYSFFYNIIQYNVMHFSTSTQQIHRRKEEPTSSHDPDSSRRKQTDGEPFRFPAWDIFPFRYFKHPDPLLPSSPNTIHPSRSKNPRRKKQKPQRNTPHPHPHPPHRISIHAANPHPQPSPSHPTLFAEREKKEGKKRSCKKGAGYRTHLLIPLQS
jgi:hypothetical protein